MKDKVFLDYSHRHAKIYENLNSYFPIQDGWENLNFQKHAR